MTTTPKRAGGLTPLAKLLMTAALGVAAVFSVKHFAPSLFGGTRSPARSSVPPKAELRSAEAVRVGAAPQIAPPMSQRAGCTDKTEVRMLIWAWNAQQGLLFANGGPQAVEDSLMCKRGVNLVVQRQDAVDQMQASLIACARELASGSDDCKSGAHYVAIMGDGAAAFFAALNPQLATVCDDCTAEIIGSAGYSRGEDKLLGLPAWRANPASAAGALIAGYLRDGDWNIAMKWAGDNGICNNPDETTYDPSCLNWVNASDYIDAGQKYIANYCEERPVVRNAKHTGDKARVCVNGVVTWTPGDVNVAQGRGGLVSIASTKEYVYQMPNVLIGLRKWNRGHRAEVIGLLGAMTDGGQQVKQSAAARHRAAEISATVYKEKDAAYWAKYFDVVVERDVKGLEVELGGSAVNNLADNLNLFGLADGSGLERSIFAATYRVFGNIVVHYYPKLVPKVPAVGGVVDSSYLRELAEQTPVVAAAALPVYSPNDPAEDQRQVVGRQDWSINFKTGSDAFTADAAKVLEELHAQTIVTHTILEVTGHTDADGAAEDNRELSRRRALAVKSYLARRAPTSFPEARFRVGGLGEDAPIAVNDTAANKARNRRVEIVMRAR